MPPSRRQRLGGLDGLRALAVAAVVCFHLDATALPGGFLGVDLFFVISGFLITRILLTELTQTGSLDLGRFYRNRVRRLFPSVAVLIVVVAIASQWIWRDQLATLQASVLSSLGYVTNWWLIFDHQSYFVSTGRPPMLQHLWSLAIEEQYYLLWPLVILLVTVAARATRNPERRVAAVIRVALLLAVASAAVMAVLAVRGDVPYASDSARIYYGTDTHSVGLFLGSAAGAWNVLTAGRIRPSRRAFLWATDLLAVAGLTALIWEFLHLDEFRPALYRGGFLLLDAIAVVVICAVARRGSAVGWLLDRPVLRWIGKRSYAIYLWHWPVVVVTRPQLDVHGPALLVDLARLALILVLAELSYRLVECPLRARDWSWNRSWQPKRVARALLVRGPVVGTLLVGAVVYLAAAPQATTAASLGSGRPSPSAGTPSAGSGSPALASTEPTTGASPTPSSTTAGPTSLPAAVTASVPPPSPTAPAVKPSITAFGDSVLLGAQPALAALDSKTRVDAVEGRQAYLVLNDIVTQHQQGQLGDVVVIHTGNNGVINPSQLSSVLVLLADRAKVIVLTDKVPRDWEAPNNATITNVCGQFGYVTLIDWNSISSTHPDWFYADGLHLRPSGASAYAQLIVTAAGG
jgi:peptidoglycan/LPS O-acetylase OafA/YrhL